MAWFLRAVEREDGHWTCKWGLLEFDSHAQLDDAVAHLRMIPADNSEVRVFAHRRDGTVSEVAPDAG